MESTSESDGNGLNLIPVGECKTGCLARIGLAQIDVGDVFNVNSETILTVVMMTEMKNRLTVCE